MLEFKSCFLMQRDNCKVLSLSDSGCFQPDITSCEEGPAVSRVPELSGLKPNLKLTDVTSELPIFSGRDLNSLPDPACP